jgi:large subunit ribosomal protein L23
MANVKYYDVILKPVVTEKSMNEMAKEIYLSGSSGSKQSLMIKEAVEKMFEGAKVAKVNTMNLDGKKKTKRHESCWSRTAKHEKGHCYSDREQQGH